MPVEFVLRPTNQLTNMPSYVSVRKKIQTGIQALCWMRFYNRYFRLKIFLRMFLVSGISVNCHCHWHGLVMNSMDMHIQYAYMANSVFLICFLRLCHLGLESNCNTCIISNLSLSIILKIFFKFGQFQPQCSYKLYSYKEKRVYIRPSTG